MQYDVIVVGAGPSGLMALRELRKAGLNACVLEANAAAGGRCATIEEPGFDVPVETGAEFIHGGAKTIFRLLKEGNIQAEEVRGNMIPIRNGVWLEEDDQEKVFKQFSKIVGKLDEDQTLQDVLSKNYNDEDDQDAKQLIEQFAKGFCLADPARISAKALVEEWGTMDEKQYRIEGGYARLINYLVEASNSDQTDIITLAPVHRIVYNEKGVIVHTSHGQQYTAQKIIITVPIPVLQSDSILFEPGLTDHRQAWNSLAAGSVIKMIFAFRDPFWLEKDPKAAFFLSNETIPTWWTHSEPGRNILTGWLGGPDAQTASAQTGDTLYESALQSIASIFHVKTEFAREQLVHHKIVCWDQNPFVRGGYTYVTPASAEARKILSVPVRNAIYFAGEALYEDYPQGTVEAALASGEKTAREVILSF